MADKKRIHVSSNITFDSQHYHKTVHNHNTGETKTIDNPEPHTTSSSTTVTSNPVTVETDGIDTTTKQGSRETTDHNPQHQGFDTSQL